MAINSIHVHRILEKIQNVVKPGIVNSGILKNMRKTNKKYEGLYTRFP